MRWRHSEAIPDGRRGVCAPRCGAVELGRGRTGAGRPALGPEKPSPGPAG